MINEEKKKILAMISNNQITAEEGVELYKKISSKENITHTTCNKDSLKKDNHPEHKEYCGCSFNDIAIIGISAKFANSNDVEEYWENLIQGKKCIEEISKEKIDLTNIQETEKEFIKYGGFISDIDKFDPLFFNISPKEAEYMDPRQRLFLEESYKAIEDAGYATKDLSGKKCGVFVGIQQGEYLERFLGGVNENVPTCNSLSVIPARISYILNLKGPSIALDTACSSSLVALSLACDSINSGNSDMAIAGGIQLMLTPWIYMSLGKLGMLNNDGKCKPFDDGADGITLGEGVGAIILKKYKDAKRDGDHIYGIIKGIGVNQDGKTNGIMAPNGPSQTALELEVYNKFNINPEDITYVEAHGTGTKLGDPIEINALTEAFRKFTNKKQFCNVSSVKGNIGHTLSSSGIASVIKVLLSMKHGKIPATINYDNNNNKLINFNDSPFYVGTKNEEWKIKDGKPRTAAISSFGMSGTNCHLVISEDDGDIVQYEENNQKIHLLALSAKSEFALENKAKEMLQYLQNQGREYRLQDIAYSSLIGRDHYDFRSIFLVKNKEELQRELTAFINKQSSSNYICSDKTNSNSTVNSILKETMDKLFYQFNNNDFSPEEYEKVAKLICKYYIKGYEIEFSKMFENTKNRRVSLPTYPFEYMRCWLDGIEGKRNKVTLDKEAKTHPLLLKNISTMKEISFESEVGKDDEEVWYKSLFNTKMISEADLLEMAIKAAELASKNTISSLKDIKFANPITEDEMVSKIRIDLSGDNENINYILYNSDRKEKVYSKGNLKADLSNKNNSGYIDIDKIKGKTTVYKTKEEVYSVLENQGIRYDVNLKVIDGMYSNITESLVSIKISCDEYTEYKINSRILEAALQMINMDIVRDGGVASVVYDIKEVNFSGDLNSASYIYFKNIYVTSINSNNNYDIFVMNKEGKVLVALKGINMVSIGTNNLVAKEQYSVLKKDWVRSQKTLLPKKPRGKFIIIINNEINAAGLETIKAAFDNTIVICDCISKENNCQGIVVDFRNEDESKRVIDEILNMNLDIEGVVDFSDIHKKSTGVSKKSYGKILFLQAIVKKFRGKGIKLIHLTRGVQGLSDKVENLAGADIAGVIRMLGSEYRNVKAKTVDINFSISDIEKQISLIYTELNIEDDFGEICYVDGIRYEPYIDIIKQENKWISRNVDNIINLDPKKVFVVTGGTRGVGAEIAKLLVRRGAKKLVIMGVTPYPSKEKWANTLSDTSHSKAEKEKIKRIIELEECGVEVKICVESLTDKDGLKKYFDNIRSNIGEIGGVIHCAGSSLNNDSAFISKNIEDIKTVFEPKVEGVEILHQVLENSSLDFFILFSSIAALSPLLSVGLSDYGTANYYMDTFAKYQYSNGNKYYKSIIWPSWLEVGMLVDLGFNLSPVYTNVGLTAHGLADGLFMMEDMINCKEHPSVIPVITDTDKFNKDKLLKIKDSKEVNVSSSKVNNSVEIHDLNERMEIIRELLCEELKIPKDKIKDNVTFGEIGVDSIVLVEVIKRLDNALHIKMDPSLFLEYPDLKSFSEYLLKDIKISKEEVESKENVLSDKNHIKIKEKFNRVLQNIREEFEERKIEKYKDDRIAVIGIGCNFPGARNKESFWNNLKNGVNSITEVPKSRWDIDKLYSPAYEVGKSTSKWGGFIEDIELFDGEYFDIKENADQVSPLMRQYLEITTNVINDAGYERAELSGKKVGIFVGTHAGSYPSWVKKFNKNTIVGIGQNFIAAYASHFFNFKGPSLIVDSACSSSLMSLHLACQSIKLGESEMAIAGGVDLMLDERSYMVFSASKAMSPNGRCNTFDLEANGIVPGEGCGAVLLKPLTKAIEDGDRIYAVIEASASNNDGRTMGVTTPNIKSQVEVINEAIKKGNINPRSIGYVEAHGTGTMIGDPIELKALTSVFKNYTNEKQFCGVGSVKTNIGHCLSAAGIASFIKTALCVYNKTLVPTLNCSNPNPRFDFKNSPFYPVMKTEKWERSCEVRRAGISSFGFGGTNVHIIIGECEDAMLDNYIEKRKPLELELFNKKRAWVNEEVKDINKEQEEKDQFMFLDFIEE
ncbi:SDR family NAD(P)-dependent oxidoreductase [Clostridium estertheticum]|uniref:type I polyketide synthase n=1 Tax=Clostridium estertheticum TaxID=238834 RepID=UPI0013EE5CEC|nr:type I polyketide synthase [Clostridium estertheticum]MBZ9609089.1 SDR family NAD(P)-dependent oxidoreductase [Clostridium estertheticum]